MELPHEQHDIVVVGAGPSGCALVSALVREGLQVLLIEAGTADGCNHVASEKVGDWLRSCVGPHSLQYKTTPQAALNGRRVPIWRGAGGGGCSIINAGLYMRGRRQDYEDWPWALTDIEDSFKRVERDMDVERVAAKGIGAVQFDMFREAGYAAANKAENEPGWVEDGIQDHMWVTGAAATGRRRTCWEALIRPLLSMPNLRVMSETTAQKLLLDDSGACVGVLLKRRGVRAPEVLRVARGAEVVLCGGTFATPKLLMLSGIGPAAHLAEMDVPLVRDVPSVGQNLQDHVIFGVSAESRRPVTEDMFNSIGVHGAVHGSYEGRNWHILVNDCRTHSDMVPLLVPQAFTMDGWLYALLRFVLSCFLRLLCLLPPVQSRIHNTISATICLMGPESRGRVRLARKDPDSPPELDPKFMRAAQDWRTVYSAFLKLRGVQTGTPKGLAWVGKQTLPGPIYKDAEAEKDFFAFVRSFTLSYFHPVGTCSMGFGSGSNSGGSNGGGGGNGGGNGGKQSLTPVAAEAAVDPKTLLVAGLHNLRVADCSLAPRIPSAPTQAMALMIGDMAAKTLLKDEAMLKRARERISAANRR